MIETINILKGASGENYLVCRYLDFLILLIQRWPQWLQALLRFLRSKKRQRSIICGLLKLSRKGFEDLFLFACCVERIFRRVASVGQK